MKKILLLSILSVSVFSQTSNIFEPIDVFDLEYVSNTEISPIGNKVLYQRNFNNIMNDQSFSNIWIINFDGTDNRPITTGNFKDNSPKWSNKGDKFIFKSNREGKSQIFLFNLRNNSLQKLTNFQYSMGSLRWSPDDNYILFSSFIDSKREKLITMPEKPKGAKWNDPPVEISDLNYKYAQYNFASLLYKIKEYRNATQIFKSIDYKNSKSYLLKSLFELNDKQNFFIELDKVIEKGKTDALIASLVASAEIKYGIKKKNLFCEDPLNYVINKNLIKHYDFEKIFIKPSKKILNNENFKDMSQPLLINAIQSAGNIFYKNNNEFLKKIEDIIHNEIEKYRTFFNKSKEGIIKNWPKNYELKGWLVKMKEGGKIEPHIHDHGWLSGSIYINVPPKLEMNSGNLVVCLNDQQVEISKNNSDTYKVIDVETGSLCLFPASLYHYTIPVKSNEERIVLAFDVMSK